MGDDESRKKPRSSEMHHLPVPSSDAGMRLDAQEACRRFSRGQCIKGELCRYAHVIGNVRETEGERGHWAVSQRRTERVNFCQFFLGGQPCPYGSKCRFLHETSGNLGDSDFRETSAICIATNNDGRRPKRQTNDPRVRQNQNTNPIWAKTKLCLMWEKMGRCWYGSTCTYAHGNAELRNVDYPNPLDSSRGHDQDTASNNTESGTVQHGKQFMFKWTDVKKISQVYADWIDDDASGQDGN
ncbi:zinc finger CCCH domain-containing protein 39-like [Ipomoea triloba]|uniref:zinc finger CCCH domain-containing protein 39-like n=1 Tax=Ipomoea triloba TaxID=35885 RepID=UPI00125E4F26|nr:zinc finger CCCH domain-containing protein 39-like [Ipomoea triloba]